VVCRDRYLNLLVGIGDPVAIDLLLLWILHRGRMGHHLIEGVGVLGHHVGIRGWGRGQLFRVVVILGLGASRPVRKLWRIFMLLLLMLILRIVAGAVVAWFLSMLMWMSIALR
jgi:hypothetical protein